MTDKGMEMLVDFLFNKQAERHSGPEVCVSVREDMVLCTESALKLILSLNGYKMHCLLKNGSFPLSTVKIF